VIPRVTDHVTSPTAHGTVSRMPSHFDNLLVESASDNLGDAAHAELVDDVDSCYGYSVVATRKQAETACPRTYYRSPVIQNASRGTRGASYAWGVAALLPVSEYLGSPLH
jgi:hypothetical protein